MKKLLFAVPLLMLTACVSASGVQPAPQAPRPTPTPRVTQAIDTSLRVDAPSSYQAMVTRYCVGCHNTREPAACRRAPRARQGELRGSRRRRCDLGASGQEAWRGRDAAAGLADAGRRGARTVSLGARRSLDRAASADEQPGPLRPAPLEPHRVRQRGARSARRHGRRRGPAAERRRRLRVRQHRERRSKTSPLLLERYLTAGLRVAELAVGDAERRARDARPTRSAPSSRRTSTSKGCRSARAAASLVSHTFPADGEYVFSGRLLKTVAEGLVGVEGHETPHLFVVTIDGRAGLLGADRRQGGPRRSQENTPCRAKSSTSA